MTQLKRLLSFNQLINYGTKKFQGLVDEEKSVSCIENLSNDLFYEIFDYLDSCDTFEAFSNLNSRFQQFLNSSSFLLKVCRFSTTERTFERYCKQIVHPNKHKIISLYLYGQALINLFCKLCNIDLLFTRLESVVLNGIKLNQLLPLLIDFMVLPRLFSLSIRLIGDYKDFSVIYTLVFTLPSLKYMKFSPIINKRMDLLPIATSAQISPIEYLNINHQCTVNDLSVILSYIPHLRHLTCDKLFQSENPLTLTLSNLRYISINECYLDFNEFEILIKQICSQLQVLRIINRSNDISYLDADRWEQLISQYIIHLRIFDFQFFENVSIVHLFTPYHTRMNRFTSSFWIKRRWIFELEITSGKIIYSVHSCRKRWCDFHDLKDIDNSSIQFNPAIQLTIKECYLDKKNKTIIDRIKSISSWVRITRLNIDSKISILAFIDLINFLSNVDSLEIHPMTAQQTSHLNETLLAHVKLRNNNITKMNIGLTTEIAQINFFLDFFPHMKHLEINCAKDIDLEILVQCIISKIGSCIIPQLCSLCLCVGQTNDEIIEKLHRIMGTKDFLHDYTIKYVYDRIYLYWK